MFSMPPSVIMMLQRGDIMKILYKQSEQDKNSSLSHFGVQNCYLKKLSIDRDHSSITKKSHHHTGFEVHIVTEGYQEYEVSGTVYKLESGSFLIIHPNVSHKVIYSTPQTQKYSITFNRQADYPTDCLFGVVSDRISQNLSFIANEASLKKEISDMLIENIILEILVLSFRISGIKENEKYIQRDENATISMAKQYIDDNIETVLSVSDVSAYCYLSTKQLTRLFKKFEDTSPGEYIIGKRVKHIEKLLAVPSLSLKQISIIMNFENEYYFNTFFKKHSGMPPGEFRKMLGK